jgi:hypothetical protein
MAVGPGDVRQLPRLVCTPRCIHPDGSRWSQPHLSSGVLLEKRAASDVPPHHRHRPVLSAAPSAPGGSPVRLPSRSPRRASWPPIPSPETREVAPRRDTERRWKLFFRPTELGADLRELDDAHGVSVGSLVVTPVTAGIPEGPVPERLTSSVPGWLHPLRRRLLTGHSCGVSDRAGWPEGGGA